MNMSSIDGEEAASNDFMNAKLPGKELTHEKSL